MGLLTSYADPTQSVILLLSKTDPAVARRAAYGWSTRST